MVEITQKKIPKPSSRKSQQPLCFRSRKLGTVPLPKRKFRNTHTHTKTILASLFKMFMFYAAHISFCIKPPLPPHQMN